MQHMKSLENKRKKETTTLSNKILARFDLDYRTEAGLKELFKEGKINKGELKIYLQPDFYNLDNMLELAKDKDLSRLIPICFYENEEFIKKSGITRLPDRFSAGNPKIREFTILPEITEIGEKAFFSCGNLQKIYAAPRKKGLKIEIQAFMFCIRLQEVILNCQTEIGPIVFSDCLSLKKIRADIARIKIGAFNGCVKLEEIRLTNLKIIAKKAFHDCIRLKYVYAPAVEKIEAYAFENCYSLKCMECRKIPAVEDTTFFTAGSDTSTE